MRKILLAVGCFVTTMFSYAQMPSFKWAININGPEVNTNDIVVDVSGNIYVTGYFTGPADFDPDSTQKFTLTSAGGKDAFISKYDAAGKFKWAKAMGGSADNIGNSIAIDASGNVCITGSTEGAGDFDPGAGTFNITSLGNTDIFILRLDANGDFAWAKSLGQTGFDNGHSIAIDPSGNIFITGAFYYKVDFDPGTAVLDIYSAGYNDIFILKLDKSGNFVWVKTIGGSQFDTGVDIAIDKLGNIYTTGSYCQTVDFDPGTSTFSLPAVNYDDIFILKLDASGKFIWAKSFGGTLYDYGFTISVDPKGNVYTTGSFQGTADFDPGSGTFNLMAFPYSSLYISKLDASGNFKWAKSIGNNESISVISSALDASGNIYTTGDYQDTMDFDPGAGKYILSPQHFSSTSMFISKLDSNGNFSAAISLKSPNQFTTGTSMGGAITVDALDNIYAAGWFQGDYDFDPGSDTCHLKSKGIDGYIMRFGLRSLNVKNDKYIKGINIYPNPNSGNFQIKVPNLNDKIIVEVYNTLGVLLYNTFTTGDLIDVDLSSYADGIFIVRVINNYQGIGIYKITKQ